MNSQKWNLEKNSCDVFDVKEKKKNLLVLERDPVINFSDLDSNFIIRPASGNNSPAFDEIHILTIENEENQKERLLLLIQYKFRESKDGNHDSNHEGPDQKNMINNFSNNFKFLLERKEKKEGEEEKEVKWEKWQEEEDGGFENPLRQLQFKQENMFIVWFSLHGKITNISKRKKMIQKSFEEKKFKGNFILQHRESLKASYGDTIFEFLTVLPTQTKRENILSLEKEEKN